MVEPGLSREPRMGFGLPLPQRLDGSGFEQPFHDEAGVRQRPEDGPQGTPVEAHPRGLTGSVTPP